MFLLILKATKKVHQVLLQLKMQARYILKLRGVFNLSHSILLNNEMVGKLSIFVWNTKTLLVLTFLKLLILLLPSCQ